MEALNFDDLPSSGSAGGKASGAITFDDLPGDKSGGALTFDDIGSDEGGIMSTVGNIGLGIGERAANLAGGFVRFGATAIEPVGDWLQRNVGDFVKEPDGSITFRRLTEDEAAQPSGVLSSGQAAAKKLESVKLGYEQGTSWEDFKSSPIKNFIPFALEQGLVSTPDMVAALTNLPAYIAARTGEMAQDRAENNNLDNATVEDLIKVMPGAVASSMLERIGAKGILADTAVKAASQLPKAVGKAALKEGTTEAGQELIEYGSTNIGTEVGFDPATAAERMAAGAVAGTGFGAAARTATAGIEAARGEPVVDPATQPDGNPEYIRADQLDVPAKADSADILYGADPEVVRPETQEQQKAVEELAPVDPERLDSPRLTAEDRASPLPNDLIDDGKAVMDGSAPAQPVAEPLASAEPVPASDPVQQAEAAPAVSVGQAAVTFDDIAADQTQAAPAAPVEAAPAAAVTPVAEPALTASQPKLARPQRMTPDGFPADRAGNVKKPKSIIEFLAERGGIRDPKGDLAAMGLTGGKGSFVGGAGSLVRKGGMTLDYARKLAVEAGYLTDTNGAGPSTSTVTDLLDAIDQDTRNGRQFFSQADANHAVRWQESQKAIQDLEQYGSEQEYRFRQAVDQVTALTGAKPDDPVAVDIATLMAQDDVDFDTAAIAVERRIDEKLAGTGREYKFELPQFLNDIPFFGDTKAASARIDDGQFPGDTAADTGAVYENSNGSRGAGNPVQGSSTEGRPASNGRTGDGSRSVQADDGERAQEPRSEVGAGGNQQLVIPGAEQISQREQAQRKADEKLKPKVEQRDAGGMFGDDANSPQLFDKPASKLAKETSKVSEEGSKVSDEPKADEAPPKETASAEKPMLSKDREGSLSENFKGDIDAITADLRARLDKLGLPDVALRVVPVIEGYSNGEKFTAHGSYFRGLIDISLQAPDKTAPLNHEAIHALKNLNAFTKTEWSMLSAKSKSDWMSRYGINEAYAGSSEAVQIEEGIAAAYTEWAAGREKAGAFARLFQKIRDIIASIGNALRGNGYDSVGKIFQRVESGDVGNSRFFKNDADADGAKRFQIVKDPANQEEAKQVMQGFIARGQPIDRAVRLPFEVLGGINKDGTWKPALKVNEKLGSSGRTGLGIGVVIGAGIGTFAGGPIGTVVGGAAGATAGVALLRANISPTGRFGWMYPVAENARRGLIDRYGLSEEYVEADRSRQTSQRGIMQKAQDILQVLQNASVGPAEAKVLQAVLTGENVTDTEMMKVAAPIRKAIDELGAEAVSLGLISAESFERNRGAYLHRVYQKNEMDQSGVIAWGSKFMAKKRVRIMGDQLKGRGIFWDVPLDKLMADVPGWLEGQTGTPANGQRFKVLDYIAGTSKDMLTGEEKENQTKRRVYLPADGPIPKKFKGAGWVDRGNWEVRKTGKDVTLWRDYTKDERTKMGEVLDARYTIAKTFMMMANDLSTGRFYKQVAENEEWAQIKPPAMEWREAADYGRFWNDPEIGWVRVPETTIANSGGKKRYGALSGMFVRAEIWRDLNEVDQMSKSGIWRTILTQWKINKTARSPVTHMNNIMSNMMFMDMADVRMQDLSKGIKSFIKGDAEYMAARDAGAFGGDMIAQELRKEVLQPILDDIAKTGADGKNPLLARMGMLGTVADKIWTWAKVADDRMLTAYQMEDEVFRMATYLRRRSLGDSVEVSAKHAREQFLDYDIRAPWVNAARNSVLPFISYSYRAIPKIAENVMNRPWKVAKYFALAYAANMLAYMWDDGDDGEDRERASLRDEEQGYTWFGIPRMMRMPYRDADGMPVFLDVRRWIPSGDVFDTNQGQSAIPVPSSLQLGGPLLLAFEFALNKQSFTGNEITNDLTDTSGDKAAKVGDWLWKSWMPSAAWVPNSWYWEKIENALKGAEDYSGRKYSLPEAALSSVGIKLKPQNVEDGLGWKQRAFKEVERELRTEGRRLANRRERGLISQSEFDKSMAQLSEKFTNLGEKAKDLGEQAKPKPKPKP